jgi:hypothetical protein
VFGVAVAGCFGLIGILVATRNQRPTQPEPETTLNLNG